MNSQQVFDRLEQSNVTNLACAWLRKEEWPRWLAADPGFQPDHERWREKMESAFADLKRRGVNAIWVTVPFDDFIEWTTRNLGGRCDSQARAHYAADVARRMQETH